jgi:hypothetical protein
MRTVATGVVCLSCVLVACGSSSGGGSGNGGLGSLLGGTGTAAGSSSGSGTGSGSGTSGTSTGSSGAAATGSASGSVSGIAGASGAGTGATSGAGTGATSGATTGASGVTSGTSGGSGTTSGTTSGDTTTSCNSIAQAGPGIDPVFSSGTPPTPEGGTLVDGTYALTALTFYGADATTCEQPAEDYVSLGLTIAETYVLSGSSVESVLNEFGTIERASSTFVVSADALTVQQTCTSSGSPSESLFEFTATGTTVTLFGTESDCGTEVETLTKQ